MQTQKENGRAVKAVVKGSPACLCVGPRLTRLSRSSSDKEPASYTTQHTAAAQRERNSQHARETGGQSENEHAGLDVKEGTEEVSRVLTRTLGLPALGPFLVRWDRR